MPQKRLSIKRWRKYVRGDVIPDEMAERYPQICVDEDKFVPLPVTETSDGVEHSKGHASTPGGKLEKRAGIPDARGDSDAKVKPTG